MSTADLTAPSIEHLVGWLEPNGPSVSFGGRIWSVIELTGGRACLDDSTYISTNALLRDGQPVLSYQGESGPSFVKTWARMVRLAVEEEER